MSSYTAFMDGLDLPQEVAAVSSFDRGWQVGGGELLPFLRYTQTDRAVNWSDDLEELHEESSRTHFLDRWTRKAMLRSLEGHFPANGAVVDLGCSTGYLLEDLEHAYPDALIAGVDLVEAGLRRAHERVPGAALFLADVCELPFGSETVDAIVSANLLEHVRDDVQALAESLRVLRPGSRAILVVPLGPGLYDYYDRHLDHERRYGHGELARKAREGGFAVVREAALGSLLYPAFWARKKLNRILYDSLTEPERETRVRRDIAATKDSRVGRAACAVDRWAFERGIGLPLGIRDLVVLEKPGR